MWVQVLTLGSPSPAICWGAGAAILRSDHLCVCFLHGSLVTGKWGAERLFSPHLCFHVCLGGTGPVRLLGCPHRKREEVTGTQEPSGNHSVVRRNPRASRPCWGRGWARVVLGQPTSTPGCAQRLPLVRTE